MGFNISKLINQLFAKAPVKMCMVGLDGAGKTATLYQLHMGESCCTIPTIGFNVECVEFKNMKMTIWDVGGQHRLRPLWRHYYNGCDAVIYLVDSADRERLSEAASELSKVLSADELRNTALLVFANKQDLPGACDPSEVAAALQLKNITGNRKWHVQGSCAVTGAGLWEGLTWLAGAVAK